MADVAGEVLVPGSFAGPVAACAPLSFWGGVDVGGTIVDVHHEDEGLSLAGMVLVMTGSRGSSSGASMIAELVRNGCGPAGMVLSEADAIIASGCLAALEIYGRTIPVVQVAVSDIGRCGQAAEISVEACDLDIRHLVAVALR